MSRPCAFNLKVVRMEYNIPVIPFDRPKEKYPVRRKIISKGAVHNTTTVVPKIVPNLAYKVTPQEPRRLVEELLAEIYGWRPESSAGTIISEPSCASDQAMREHQIKHAADLKHMSDDELSKLIVKLRSRTQQMGGLLGKRLFSRDALKRRRRRLCSLITAALKKISGEGEEADMRFSVSPREGASGWAEWLRAMRLVARLPAGIPTDFRRKLWLTLAEQHLKVKGVDWEKAEKTCFSEWTNPDDTELGVQIVKDLHRTGCSLFCGTEGRENQAVLKRVLLAYARWNKNVGYCQGFNMLAALILEVMDRSESDSLKVMIYLIEAVLPEGYFANNLRGLSVDMAVFRDLLRLRLPKLSAHLDKLQKGAAEGSCYEPPLTNVFTMQWFLTLFCNCLPRNAVLRVWDLVFLEGDEFLLTTALAIWATLQDRILAVDSADEFYSVMGELARETLEAPPAQAEELVARATKLGPVPELPRLRDKHRYNITPWAHTVQSAAKKGLRLFYSEDETDSSDEGDKLAVTTAFGLHTGGRGRGALVAAGVFGHPDRERLALDISALKLQYARLRERQRQAHIILAAACARQPHGSTSGSGPMSVNHLLMGKSAIVSSRGRRLGPPQGSIPPLRASKPPKIVNKTPTPSKNETLHWKDENHRKSISRRDSIKWKDVPQPESQSEDGEEAEEHEQEQEEEGKEVSESEINEIIQSSMRSRGKSESSSYSECSESSTSTSLCDEPNRMSDFDSEPASVSDNVVCLIDDMSKTDMSDDRETIQSDDINNGTGDNQNNEKTAAEFGSYIQEFEDLLDRTNDIDNDRGLVCVLPDEKKTDEAESDIIEVIDQETNESESDLPIEDVSERQFEEFVDSNRGEPLRNYLDEFRKADFMLKQEIPWEAVEPLHIDVFDTIKNATASSIDETDREEEQTDLDENSTNFELKNPETHDDVSVKSLPFVDYRSTSCDRSISSSISSISPIMKSVQPPVEEKSSFLSYKSPCRVDSETVNEISEDEKPLILKIDKYFEHSPEFFGARKSGTYYASSDEEDDRFVSRTRKKASPLVSQQIEFTYESIDKVQTTCERHTDHISMKKFDSNYDKPPVDIDELSVCPQTRPNTIISPVIPYEYKYTEYDHTTEDADRKLGFISPQVLSPIASFNKTSKVLQLSSPQPSTSPLNNVLKSPIEIDLGYDIQFDTLNDHGRLSLLEKTKSEDIPQEHRRSFSILDDEIDAIRSQSGRRNSERALKIIQENSKILHRILVNQVNKSTIRDSFQEQICEISEEESKHEENDDKLFKILTKKTHKCLFSPRSSSLDDHLLSKNQKTAAKPAKELSLDLETKPVRSVIYSPQFPSKENLNEDISFRARHMSKKDYVVSPISFKIGIPIYEARVTEQTKHYFTKITPEVPKPDEPLCSEENKTDKFGWENKGFNVNQRRLSAVYSDITSPPKPLIQNLISDYHDTNKSALYDFDKSTTPPENKKPDVIEQNVETEIKNTNVEVNLHLKPVEYFTVTSPEVEKGSTLTAVSEPIVEASEYIAHEYTESWKPENNNSISDSYNVTSPYKFTYKSSENSIGLDSAFKNLRKFNDSPLSRVTDTFSRVTECSPMENIPRPEGFKFETSQSSDICIVSSSMSFSFDPSVEDQQSSKPGTFNSSDTLCQLTSLDQVSTPISPKMTTYSLGKDSTGISQRDLSLELDRFKLTSEDLSVTQGSIPDLNSPSISSLKTPTSPTPSQDKTKSLKSPDKAYSPFPARVSTRQPKELGLRLGLYKDNLKSPSK